MARLFRADRTHLLQVHCTPFPMKGVFATDALSVSLRGCIYGCEFPSPVLFHLVVEIVVQEHCTLILIAPFAPRLLWYLLLWNLWTSHRPSKRTTSDMGMLAQEKWSSGSSMARHRNFKTSSLENIQHKHAERIFSNISEKHGKHPRRLSTKRVYDAKLRLYRSWCSEQWVNPKSSSVGKIAHFLHEAKGCRASTLSVTGQKFLYSTRVGVSVQL